MINIIRKGTRTKTMKRCCRCCCSLISTCTYLAFNRAWVGGDWFKATWQRESRLQFLGKFPPLQYVMQDTIEFTSSAPFLLNRSNALVRSRMAGIKRFHDGKPNNDTNMASPFMRMFEVFRNELDEHHDRRERIIKASRDITALSKKM